MIQPELQAQLKQTLSLQDGAAALVDRLANIDVHTLNRMRLRGEAGVAGKLVVAERLAQQLVGLIDKAIREEGNDAIFWETPQQSTERLQGYREQREELIAQVNGAFEAFGFANRVTDRQAAKPANGGDDWCRGF